jgi:YegS/Rv2252/BmrU family lipid kinase
MRNVLEHDMNNAARSILIYNPASGRKKAGSRAVDFAENYRQRFGTELVLRPTRSLEDLRNAARESARAFDLQIIMGGDGTISEALQGLSESADFQPLPRPVGLLPAGSGNSFLRDFGITDYATAREALLESLETQATTPIDMGLIRHIPSEAGASNEGIRRICFHFFGVGLVCDIADQAMRMRYLGSLNYTAAALGKILAHRPYRLRVTVDGVTEDVVCNFLTVSNTRYTGGSMMIAPPARVNDGRLFLLISRIQSRFEILRMMPKIFQGRHLDHPGAEGRFVSEVHIEREQPLMFNVDGELRVGRKLSISVLPSFWKVFLPSERLLNQELVQNS